ncbi:hypothetical protein [Marinobacter sp.]|uniref:hypothetical protein n=1 Tax=Marinobacter sp. TaxID=50741 RepID=UPI003563EF00
MPAPDFNNIDLVLLPAPAPDFNNIDLPALENIDTTVTLDFSVSGTGETPLAGTGAVTLPFIVTGAGLKVSGGELGLDLTASGTAKNGFEGQGSSSLSLSASGGGFSDWLSLLPAIQLQELYRLKISGDANGLDDLYIGQISSWQATNQAGTRSSYVQAVIPDAEAFISDIDARKDGSLSIQKGYRLADGSERYEEILSSRFDLLRPDRGGRALTLTVSGYIAGKPISKGYRKLTGVRSISSPSGKRRVRCDIDMFLQPGMTVDALGEVFTAGYINYYVNETGKFCEVGER